MFQRLSIASLLILSLQLSGCQQKPAVEPPQAAVPFADVPDDQLRAMIDDALRYTLDERRLSLDVNAAWQILHGALPFGTHFQVQNGDQTVSAMQWVLDGNQMNGWTLRHGSKDLPGGRRGLKMVMEPGTKTGQGHEDQWLAVMSQCGLPKDQKIIFQGQQYQLWDVLQQSMWDIYPGKECSWSLIALTRYLDDFDLEWKSSDGETWTLEKVLQMEADEDLSMSACGGSHRLIGMTMALESQRKRGGELTDAWLAAEDKIQGAIETAQRHQQPDGSFSTNYFARPGTSADLALRINTTGHTLEFLSLGLDKDQLEEPWIENAVVQLCELFKKTEPIPLECGSLYHAAHGLIEYRERRFGPWPYLRESRDTEAEITADSDAPAEIQAPRTANEAESQSETRR